MSSREVTVATNNDVATLIRVRTTSNLKYQGTSDFWILDLSDRCIANEQENRSRILDGVNRGIGKEEIDGMID